MKDFYSYHLYIFDLDNTLFHEEDYLFGAYGAIAEQFNNPDIYPFLKNTFQKDGRQMLLNKMIEQFKLPSSSLSECLHILRSHKPDKQLLLTPQTRGLLADLKARQKTLAILTNGNTAQQKNKFEILGTQITEYFDLIVFANEIEPKPSPKGIESILTQTGIEKENTLLIGDSETDAAAAKNAGVDFLYASELPVI